MTKAQTIGKFVLEPIGAMVTIAFTVAFWAGIAFSAATVLHAFWKAM